MEKGAQLKLSFGMIFSIILIIIFLGLAIYIIPKILNFQHGAQVGIFVTDLQNDVDKMWQGAQGSQEKIYNVPGNIESVCFREDAKISFIPHESSEGFDLREIKHLDGEETTIAESPFCIENDDGKISLTIKKDFGESLVTIVR